MRYITSGCSETVRKPACRPANTEITRFAYLIMIVFTIRQEDAVQFTYKTHSAVDICQAERRCKTRCRQEDARQNYCT